MCPRCGATAGVSGSGEDEGGGHEVVQPVAEGERAALFEAVPGLLVWLVWEIAGMRIPVVFPFWNVWIALAGTLALLVLLLPLRRAVRFRPGDALRSA